MLSANIISALHFVLIASEGYINLYIPSDNGYVDSSACRQLVVPVTVVRINKYKEQFVDSTSVLPLPSYEELDNDLSMDVDLNISTTDEDMVDTLPDSSTPVIPAIDTLLLLY